MEQNRQLIPTAHRCPVCGLELPVHVPVELCPKCLLKTGVGDGEAATVVSSSAAVKASRCPQPGERFGHYQLVRMLGAGGMGAVYEADDEDSDRRVALKVLSQRFDSTDARVRFLREGRLAASINHPNSVYVFGTEEIDGVPVIAMELMPGGTLEQRVRREGPLDSRIAVDITLQIVAGLEAAHAVGILHRDIKPSNCFLDADGTVKIGDFGLSISTAAHHEARVTVGESFMGTPAFASPEQIRGDELTVRSDIYSVGVTLFYLLTKRLPHESDDMVRLMAKVLENPVPSPAQDRPDLPARLCQVVLRCLAKCPTDRFKDYDELRGELVRFSSSGTQPAPLNVRFLAGAVDLTIIYAVLALAQHAVPVDRAWMEQRWFLSMVVNAAQALVMMAVGVFYFALPEGLWGWSPGKALLRLRVVNPAGRPAGLRKALLRAAVFVAAPLCLVLNPVSPSSSKEDFSMESATNDQQYSVTSEETDTRPTVERVAMPYVILAGLLFCMARRRNGFAGLHDLASDTRVVTTVAATVRPVLAPAAVPPDAARRPQIGPFHVLENIAGADDWFTGYDSRLLRRVWIHNVPAGTPAVTKAQRSLGRAGRLRWIAGKRSESENWDAYEGITGQPLLKLIEEPQPWSVVRFWLLDLSTEIQEALKDGTLPSVLSLDRVWITGEGRAKLFDFPVPGVAELSPAPNFLADVATRALADRPVPLYARDFLRQLPTLTDAAAVVETLKSFMNLPPVVSQARRLGIAAAGAAGPAVLGLVVMLVHGGSLDVALWLAGVVLVFAVAFPAMVASLIDGAGALFRLFGVAVVRLDGQPASRTQLTRRNLIAWLPSLCSPVVVALLASHLGAEVAYAAVFAGVALLAVVSAAWPGQSLPDRLSKTCLVPR